MTSVTPGARAPDGSPPGRSAPAGAPRVWKSRGRLADGREIIYFDEAPGLGRDAVPDRREIPNQQPAGTEDDARHGLRWDPLTGEWVVVAAARQDRTFLPPAEHCPLCPTRPGRLTEIPAPGYDVVVFQNRFPALAGPPAEGPGARTGALGADGPGGRPPSQPDGDLLPAGQPADLLAGRRPAHGRCEVVCFTSDHHGSFAGLSASRVRTVLEAWADRTAELGSLPGIRQVYCFENRGEQIGVTLHHPHGQIYAFPFVAPHTARVLEQARAYAAAGRGNLFDDLVALERDERTRVVARNEHWIAFVPAAARWPFELMLFPARRVGDLPSLGEAARDAFCPVYLDVLRRLDALFGAPMPYIAAWNQAPAGDGPAREVFGLHLRLQPLMRAPGKLKYLAGTESGMGVWVTDMTPEDAAARLRDLGRTGRTGPG